MHQNLTDCVNNLHYEKFQDGTVKCIEDEIPFEVPEGWAWCRLNDIYNFIDYRGATPTKTTNGIPLVTAKNVKSGYIDYTIDDYISEEEFKERQQRGISKKGDILFTTEAPLGNAALADIEKFSAGQRLITFQQYGSKNELINYVMLMFILSDFFQQQLCVNKTGSTVAGIKAAILKTLWIPVPPYKEQLRISNTLKSAINLIDSISQNKEILSTSISNTKSKILDLAIRGKLVPQDPNDEPASVLLERIRAEKEELIKQGKIKRDKKESVIFRGDDNSYYENLPHNWQVTSLREITTPLTLNDGDWILSQNMVNIGEVKLLQLGSIGNMIYLDKGFKYLTIDTFNELCCTEIFSGYLLINRIINDKMCCCIVPQINGKIITTVDTCWIAPTETSYDIKFLMYQLASPNFQNIVLSKTSGTTRRRISKSNLIDLPLFLPPLDEQRRIVEAIEKIFIKLDEIVSQVV